MLFGAAFLAVATYCIQGAYAEWAEWHVRSILKGPVLVVGGFGFLVLVAGVATLLQWRSWRLLSRTCGVALALYGLDVLMLGHGEDVGGVSTLLFIAGVSLAVAGLALVVPALEPRVRSAA